MGLRWVVELLAEVSMRFAPRLALLSLLSAAIAFGQALPVPAGSEPGPEPVFKVGGGVTPPHATYAPDPEYSEHARKAKYQGTCVLRMVVGSDGKPRDVKVTRSLGFGLDEEAVKAVERWKFQPAMKDGRPVAVQINVQINFRLYPGPPPQSNTRPQPAHSIPPAAATPTFTDAQLAELSARWEKKHLSSEELDKLRAQCAPYVGLDAEALEEKKAPLPPHECADVLGWMRDLRVEGLYIPDKPVH